MSVLNKKQPPHANFWHPYLDGYSVDWITATVEALAPEAIDTRLAFLFDGTWHGSSPRFGYQYAEVLHCSLGDVVLRKMWGGQGGRVYLQASGVNAPILYDFLKHYRDGEVYITRLDIALDYDCAGLFDYLLKFTETTFLNAFPNVGVSLVGDYLSKNNPKGRTFYIGSRTSPVMMRIYEKGKEQGDPQSHWVRVELELKPANSIAKKEIIGIPLRKLLYPNAWGSFFMSNLLTTGSGSEMYLNRDYVQSSTEVSFLHMCTQYKNVLTNYLQKNCRGDKVLFVETLLKNINFESEKNE